MDKRSLGLAVRQRRVELGLSQETLAESCGLHRTYVGSVERGERNVSIQNLIKLAYSLKCNVSDLILAAENMDRFWEVD